MISAVRPASQTGSDAVSEAVDVFAGDRGPSTSSWSAMASLMRRLDALSKDAPKGRFASALASVTRELEDAAVRTQDPAERQTLRRLAQRFGLDEAVPTLEREVNPKGEPDPVPVAVAATPSVEVSTLGHVQLDARSLAATRAYRQTANLAAEHAMTGLFSHLCDVVDAVR